MFTRTSSTSSVIPLGDQRDHDYEGESENDCFLIKAWLWGFEPNGGSVLRFTSPLNVSSWFRTRSNAFGPHSYICTLRLDSELHKGSYPTPM